jgi:hypothetical protein
LSHREKRQGVEQLIAHGDLGVLDSPNDLFRRGPAAFQPALKSMCLVSTQGYRGTGQYRANHQPSRAFHGLLLLHLKNGRSPKGETSSLNEATADPRARTGGLVILTDLEVDHCELS